MIKEIGQFSPEITKLLNLNIAENTPILIGDSNIEHIKNRHPYEYDKYFHRIDEIIKEPDYVGINPKDNSIGFVKLFKINSEYVRVAVKVIASGKCYCKTLHLLSTYNAERYIERGTLKKLDK